MSFWCKPTRDTTVPDPTSDRYTDLAWRLRYAHDSITDEDKMLCASVLAAFSSFAAHPAGDEQLNRLRLHLQGAAD